jgi:hypothetical protein
MSEPSTCGQGLAENAALPAGLAQVTEAMAGMLERHMIALDLTDPRSTAEHAVYGELAAAHRRIADQLRAAADRMDAQRVPDPRRRQAAPAQFAPRHRGRGRCDA